MVKIYNFSAGPAVLPEKVLKIAQKEMLDCNNTGMSVMEMSHRSSVYQEIINNAEKNLRNLMNISDEYAVLFMQGGASAQFSAAPLNLATNNKKIAVINTGTWSEKAISEAKKYVEVDVIASSKDDNFTFIPDVNSLNIPNDVDYLHIVSNNTIYGTKYTSLPKTNVPIVSDMSSCILSEEINVNDYACIFAGAQKNIGPAGLCIVIVKKSLIGKESPITPNLYNYLQTEKNGSMLNTPPTYSIYIAGLVFADLLEQGGVSAIEKNNKEKANLLYEFIDNSSLYNSPVNKNDRSLMNIPFVTGNEKLDELFVKESTKEGLLNLKGHRSVGGMRASIYNAMTIDGVNKLISFMKKFEQNNK
jgi:phosphoserine aminotransferase